MTPLPQQLYASEINGEIRWFFDLGFTWKLGDEVNGYLAEGSARTWTEAVADLAQAALVHYPGSGFTDDASAPD